MSQNQAEPTLSQKSLQNKRKFIRALGLSTKSIDETQNVKDQQDIDCIAERSDFTLPQLF
jgi:hypothetical protein